MITKPFRSICFLFTFILLSVVYIPVNAQPVPATITNATDDTSFTSIRQLKPVEKNYNDSTRRALKQLSYQLAKLKMYSLALRYYYESLLPGQGSRQKKDTHLPVNQDLLSITDTAYAQYVPVRADSGRYRSRGIRLYFKEIKEHFDDGKDPVAYALMVHVKQPVPRSRSSFAHFNNVGHTFITLIKYNSDKTATSHSFGFYPYKDHLFSATPIYPGSTAQFRNDQQHEWDETVGCIISREKFEQVLRMVKRYSHRRYNLNKNNCSDFGLCVAGIAGISIKDTKGSWPLGGHGNTPASVGQSILEGRIDIADSTAIPFLFICNNTN